MSTLSDVTAVDTVLQQTNAGTVPSACIPISYRGTTYGALVVYATKLTSVTDRERSVFSELGETIGHAINAVESKKLLYSDRVLELEFSITNTGSFFVVTSEELGCSFELDGVVPSVDDVYHFYVTSSGVVPEKVIETGGGIPQNRTRSNHPRDGRRGAIGGVVPRNRNGRPSAHRTRGLHPTGVDRERGGKHRRRSSGETHVRHFSDAVEEVYSEGSLLSKQSSERPFHSTSEFYHELGETLTERQAGILQAAYLAGYFDYPRASSGKELAETLDISSPTFHQHLQAAERKLFTLLFSGRPRID